MDKREIIWHKLTEKNLPPERTTFLLWFGLRDSDGGFPAVAKLWRDCNGRLYVMFHDAKDNWKVFGVSEWQGMMWATIPRPRVAQRKYEKDLEIKRRNGIAV